MTTPKSLSFSLLDVLVSCLAPSSLTSLVTCLIGLSSKPKVSLLIIDFYFKSFLHFLQFSLLFRFSAPPCYIISWILRSFSFFNPFSFPIQTMLFFFAASSLLRNELTISSSSLSSPFGLFLLFSSFFKPFYFLSDIQTTFKAASKDIYSRVKQMVHAAQYIKKKTIKNGWKIWIDISLKTYRWPRDTWKDAQHH